MVMKRYPNGAAGKFFFMKQAPSPRPDWIAICSVAHSSGKVIHFPMVQDLASLLWVVNLGCIDLNPWYARCDDVDRPDYVHFDLDPVPGATFATVREAALAVHEALEELRMPALAKTTGSRGHPRVRPDRARADAEQVWEFAKQLALACEARHPKLLTTEYRVAARPRGRVLVDYNQNAWGQTLASIYSVRPDAASLGLDSRHVEGGRARRGDRGLPHRQRAREARGRRRPVEAPPRGEGPGAAGEVLLTGQGSENVRDRKTAISPRETTALGQ